MGSEMCIRDSAYTDAADREDEQGIGIWISGFFGSGKSLLMKMLGVLLEGREVDGRPASAAFLDRVPAASAERADLTRFLNVCARKLTTTAVGGNLHAMLSSQNDPLALIAFKLFAGYRDYTANWPLLVSSFIGILSRSVNGSSGIISRNIIYRLF